MDSLKEFGIDILGNAIVVSVAVYVFKTWVGTQMDQRLATFQSELDKKKYISNSLYKSREQAVLDFNLAFRRFIWNCGQLTKPSMKTQQEFDSRFESLSESYKSIQIAYFQGQLVFDGDLLLSCKKLFETSKDLSKPSSMALNLLAKESGCTINGVELSEDWAWNPNEFVKHKHLIARLIDSACGEDLRKWESNARSVLLDIQVG